MRTKEPKPYRHDFEEASRRSIRRDFRNASFVKPAKPEQPKANDVKRVISLTDKSEYARYRRCIVGKLVRVLRPASCGGWYVEFVNDNDRDALNAVAGWKSKQEFLLDGVKFDK